MIGLSIGRKHVSTSIVSMGITLVFIACVFLSSFFCQNSKDKHLNVLI